MKLLRKIDEINRIMNHVIVASKNAMDCRMMGNSFDVTSCS